MTLLSFPADAETQLHVHIHDIPAGGHWLSEGQMTCRTRGPGMEPKTISDPCV